MVLCVHLGQQILPTDSSIRMIFNMGDRGVPIFFAMSGFLIMVSLEHSKSLRDYYIKRFFRIIPLYYSILIVCAFVIDMPKDELNLRWTRFFLFMNTIVPSEEAEWNSINGFWCMPAFIIFYIIAPTVYKYTSYTLKGCSIISIITIGSYFIGIAIYKFFNLTQYYSLSPVNNLCYTLPIFLYGVWTYASMKNKLETGFLTVSTIIMIISATFEVPCNYQLWGVFCSIIIMLTWNLRFNLGLNRLNKLIRFLSKISFTIFLCHYLAIRFLNYIGISDTFHYILMFVFLTISMAILLYYCIEVPSKMIQTKITASYHKNP